MGCDIEVAPIILFEEPLTFTFPKFRCFFDSEFDHATKANAREASPMIILFGRDRRDLSRLAACQHTSGTKVIPSQHLHG